jgi:hypothetical protein
MGKTFFDVASQSYGYFTLNIPLQVPIRFEYWQSSWLYDELVDCCPKLICGYESQGFTRFSITND